MEEIKILQTASYLPAKVVANDDLTQLMDTSDEWISQRTGIKRRHISLKQNTADLATQVARRLLAEEGVSPEQIGLIIVATMSPDSYTPATAARVQGMVGATNAIAFDLSAACSGFVYGLAVAHDLMRTNSHCRYAMVIGAEVLSKLVDWHDRRSAVIFGDGAGGVLLGRSSVNQPVWLGQNLRTFGDRGDEITAGILPAGESFPPARPRLSTFMMDGRGVYKFATHQVPTSVRLAANQAGISLDQIDCFVLHQANARIVKQVARRLGQPMTKFPLNISEVGNTAAASEPLLLDHLVQTGKIRRGNILALSGFGGGLTTGTIILRY